MSSLFKIIKEELLVLSKLFKTILRLPLVWELENSDRKTLRKKNFTRKKTAPVLTRGKQNKLSAIQLLTLFIGTWRRKVCGGTGGRTWID